MTATQSFADACATYNMISTFRNDFPDGMWDAAKEAADFYRESARTEADKEQFASDIEEIIREFGFPSMFS